MVVIKESLVKKEETYWVKELSIGQVSSVLVRELLFGIISFKWLPIGSYFLLISILEIFIAEVVG